MTTRELVWERPRLVPKGHWTLAGGASHRFAVKIESEPRPGLWKSRDDDSDAPGGARRIRGRYRWFAPPANIRDVRRPLSMPYPSSDIYMLTTNPPLQHGTLDAKVFPARFSALFLLRRRLLHADLPHL